MAAPSPFTEPVPATPDPLGLVAAAVPLGILVGLLVVSATVFVVTILRDAAAAAAVSAPSDLSSSPAFFVLVGGTFAAAFFAAASVWAALSPITNTFRRGMFAIVSAFATVVVMLVAMPVHAAFGQAGLVVLAAACLAGIMLLARRIRRIRALA